MSLFLTEVNLIHLSHLSHTLWETSQYMRRCCIVSSFFIHSGQRLHCILISLLTRFTPEGILSINTRQPNTFPVRYIEVPYFPTPIKMYAYIFFQQSLITRLGYIYFYILPHPAPHIQRNFIPLHCGYLTHQLSFQSFVHTQTVIFSMITSI